MANTILKCEKQCTAYNMQGFCRCTQARMYFSGLFDERGIKSPRYRKIWKNGKCQWEENVEEKKEQEGMKFDERKLRYDLILPSILEYLAFVYTYGAIKYDDNNYKKLDDIDKRYEGALFRHFQDHRKGNKFDKDSGLLHAGQVFWNAGTLLWNELEKLEVEGIKLDEYFEQLIDLWILRKTEKEKADKDINNLIQSWNKRLAEVEKRYDSV